MPLDLQNATTSDVRTSDVDDAVSCRRAARCVDAASAVGRKCRPNQQVLVPVDWWRHHRRWC